MVSRIDRLFILLDTGSTESIRLAAAKQLGEVQRVQPSELNCLLRRIKEYSGKSVWETRVAAGHATRCILEHVEPWPRSCKEECRNNGDSKIECQQEIAENLINQNVNTTQVIEQLDLDEIISRCPKLLSLDTADSNEAELISPSSSKKSSFKGRGRNNQASKLRKVDKEQLLRQRNLINKELGISMVANLNVGINSTDIVTNDDLQVEYDTSDTILKAGKNNELHDSRALLQSKLSNYDKIVDQLLQHGCISASTSITKSSDENTASCESDSIQSDDRWPLHDIAKQYSDDLFNPSWEIRHGAAIALREIVKLQGKFAGRRADLNQSSNDCLNQLWLVDMALGALCVLALDKFGDFLFDQVVAPVRENTAQILGCCVAHMTEDNVCSIINLILKLLLNQNWETRHGAILGLKYSLNVVDEALSKKILKRCFDSIFKCLKDPVDDVSAEAAASLVPIKDLMIETIPNEAPTLIKFLWEHLTDLDELTTSTSNIVLLLASLITSSSTKLETHELAKSIPKLWSLLGHSSTMVRVSVLKALITLITTQTTTCLNWMPEELITTALRLVFQRSILENMEEVRPHIEEVWMHLVKIDSDPTKTHVERFKLLKSTSQYLNYWLCLVLQPSNAPIDRGSTMWLNSGDTKPDGAVYIGSCTFNAETMNQQKLQVTKCRLLSTRLIGALYANLVNTIDESFESQHAKETLKYLADMFIHYIRAKSANQRIICGWAIESWAVKQNQLLDNDHNRLRAILPQHLVDLLNQVLQENAILYDESATTFTRLQQETRDYVAALKAAGINSPIIASNNDKRAIYNLAQIQTLCDLNLKDEMEKEEAREETDTCSSDNLVPGVKRSEILMALLNKKSNIAKSLQSTITCQKNLNTSVLSSMSCAHISWRLIPKNIKLVSEPLLDSIELEEDETLQDKSIGYLVTLFDILCQDMELHSDLVSNILHRIVDILSTRTTRNETSSSGTTSIDATKLAAETYRIVLLDNLQRKAELSRFTGRRHSTLSSSSTLKRSHSLASSMDKESESAIQSDDQRCQQNLSPEQDDLKVRGASNALGKLACHFDDEFPQRLPQLWKMITSDIKDNIKVHCADSSNTEKERELVKCLHILQVIGEKLNKKLQRHLLDLFHDFIQLLTSTKPNVRHCGSQCIGLVSKLMLDDTIDLIADKILPMLQESDNTLARCGAIEAIALIIERIQLSLVPHINMFIIHVLRRMSDQNDQIRLMATHCFGKLLSLMPLNLEKTKVVKQEESESDESIPPKVKQDDRRFIEQLLDPKKLDNFDIPIEVNAELRSYQQDGLNWLAFLNRFNLHGILCDEMGLGKTLMTICMVASDHHESKSCQPSLIVCPPTLIEHWLYEIHKFLPKKPKSTLRPVRYSGSLGDRMALRCAILDSINRIKSGAEPKTRGCYNLIVASYDIIRNDIDFFKIVQWNYCVLDEGHIIKNGKTKLSRSIRLLNANHRLILSGTPIQNNVTELWSLFDFLMPGFLGSDRQFNSKYAKPILQSREPKCSARELEAGALAMESLHRQVLPFILRRLKEDVLDDLPPKIIQDYYCELSVLQHKLYEDFARSKLCKNVTKKSIDNINGSDTGSPSEQAKTNSKNHVFQALQYLKNVCNHPKLVLTPKHPEYQEIKRGLDNDKSSLDDIAHSSKLKALKQLLIDCGIGVANQVGDESQPNLTVESVVNQHRALVFCQIRSMVDIIENDLLKKHLPGITYLKLDGSVPPNQRHSIVSRFNNDPSIDVLLLTTQIGGLGLNLTGADTVIFVEHDWNPTKDLQAMDRAHRIGQKKVVNVYRLITKGTLEEKIMGLQKFKTMVSNTVINQDNAGLASMDVDRLFDLFEVTQEDSDGSDGRPKDVKGKASIMDMLPNLWDQQQYETEYDLSSFVSSLKN